MVRRVRGAVVVALAAGLTSSLVTAPAAAMITAPVALIGTTGGVSVDDAEFDVRLWPRDDIEKTLEVGDAVPTFEVPRSAVRATGNSFSVNLNPSGVPAEFIDDDGRVHLDVIVGKPAAGLIGSASATVSLVEDSRGSEALWADPLNPLASRDRVAPATFASLDSRPTPVTMSLRMRPVTPTGSRNTAMEPDCTPTPSPVLAKNSNRNVIIGRTHVPRGTANEAWAYHGSSRSHTLGVAVNTGTGWEVDGSKTFASGITFEWAKNRARTRAYRVQTRYGKYRYTFIWGPDNECVTSYRWKPRFNTGGFTVKSSDRYPRWKKDCTRVAKGKWKRTRTDGKNFNMSGGVAMKNLVGFNLRSKRAYSTNSYIAYRLQYRKKLCGNNAAPAFASGVRMLPKW